MDPLDKLLAELQSEYQQEASEQQKQKPNIAIPYIQPSPKSSSLIDTLLEEVKTDFEEQEREEKLKQQQALEQERIRQQQIKIKQQEALQKRAKDWLTKLDPFSPEGLWFERFSERYSSKLEAAIEYLQAND